MLVEYAAVKVTLALYATPLSASGIVPATSIVPQFVLLFKVNASDVVKSSEPSAEKTKSEL